jgi:hypothetical protein
MLTLKKKFFSLNLYLLGLQNDDKQSFAFEDEDLAAADDLLSIYSGINNAQGIYYEI